MRREKMCIEGGRTNASAAKSYAFRLRGTSQVQVRTVAKKHTRGKIHHPVGAEVSNPT
jgi:hypothetical protein